MYLKRNTNKEKDYEKLLADIDYEIKKVEENLRQIKIREDRSVVTWLYYSIPLYSIILIVYCFMLYRTQNPWPVMCIQASPLLLGLFLIIFIKKFISIWYKKQQMKEEEKNVELKKEQKEILEELKSKIKYYQTKNLIEKYEIQEQPIFPMKNGMPMINPQMKINGQRMNPNQIANQQLMQNKKQQLMGGHTIQKQRSMPVVLQNGKQQFTNSKYNQQLQPSQQQQQTSPTNPNERKWIDKLVDAIVGDVNEIDNKYALVCGFCYTHCGLALPEEYKTFKYICPNCKKLNDNAKKYNINDPKINQKPVGNPLSLPPSLPNNNNIPNTHSQNVSITSQNPELSNDKKPNLIRRSSTLLDEMDDSSKTNTDTAIFNQIQNTSILNDNSEEIKNEDLNQNINNFEQIEQIEQIFEQEKEIINLSEDNINNNNNPVENKNAIQNEEEIQKEEEIQNNKNNCQTSVDPSPLKEQTVVNEQTIEENLQQ